MRRNFLRTRLPTLRTLGYSKLAVVGIAVSIGVAPYLPKSAELGIWQLQLSEGFGCFLALAAFSLGFGCSASAALGSGSRTAGLHVPSCWDKEVLLKCLGVNAHLAPRKYTIFHRNIRNVAIVVSSIT